MQNYQLNACVGAYEPGNVVPEYVLEGHDLGALAGRGLIAPTDAPVNVAVRAPAVAARAVPDSVYDERNRLDAECQGLHADNAALAGKAGDLERANRALTDKLGRAAEDEAHLKEACEAHQKAEAAALTDRDKARAEAAGLVKERDKARGEADKARAEAEKLAKERDQLRAEVAKLTKDLDAATAPAKAPTK